MGLGEGPHWTTPGEVRKSRLRSTQSSQRFSRCLLLYSIRCLGQWWCPGCCRALWDFWGLLATCSATVDPWCWPPAWLWQGCLRTGRWPCSALVTGGWPGCT